MDSKDTQEVESIRPTWLNMGHEGEGKERKGMGRKVRVMCKCLA